MSFLTLAPLPAGLCCSRHPSGMSDRRRRSQEAARTHAHDQTRAGPSGGEGEGAKEAGVSKRPRRCRRARELEEPGGDSGAGRGLRPPRGAGRVRGAAPAPAAAAARCLCQSERPRARGPDARPRASRPADPPRLGRRGPSSRRAGVPRAPPLAAANFGRRRQGLVPGTSQVRSGDAGAARSPAVRSSRSRAKSGSESWIPAPLGATSRAPAPRLLLAGRALSGASLPSKPLFSAGLGAPASPGAGAPSGACSRALPLADPWGARPLLTRWGSGVPPEPTAAPPRPLWAAGSCTETVPASPPARSWECEGRALRAHPLWPGRSGSRRRADTDPFFQEPGEPGPGSTDGSGTRAPRHLSTPPSPSFPGAPVWETRCWPHTSHRNCLFLRVKRLLAT